MNRLIIALLILPLAGCVNEKLSSPAPSIAVLKAVRAANLPPVAVGSIVAKPAGARFDRVISIRGSTVRPASGSFASDLRTALITELTAAGRYDPNAPRIVSGELVENSAGENMKSGHGAMTVNFRLSKADAVVFEKTIRSDLDWNSSFLAAVAVPNAFRAYGALQSLLIERLVVDPDFQRAVQEAK